MKIENSINYSWSWKRLSLYRCGDGWSSRVFTLWPKWIWWNLQDWVYYGPDPFVVCERWLKENGHWSDPDFYRAVTWWYANSSAPGELVRLNPTLLK